MQNTYSEIQINTKKYMYSISQDKSIQPCISNYVIYNRTYKVYKALKKFNPKKSKAIAIIINSTGGSVA